MGEKICPVTGKLCVCPASCAGNCFIRSTAVDIKALIYQTVNSKATSAVMNNLNIKSDDELSTVMTIIKEAQQD